MLRVGILLVDIDLGPNLRPLSILHHFLFKENDIVCKLQYLLIIATELILIDIGHGVWIILILIVILAAEHFLTFQIIKVLYLIHILPEITLCEKAFCVEINLLIHCLLVASVDALGAPVTTKDFH